VFRAPSFQSFIVQYGILLNIAVNLDMLIKRSDYYRIYRVINSIIEAEKGNPAYACQFFSAFGSVILADHYKLDARPKAGLAAYHFGGDNEALVFGEMEANCVTGDGDAYHCWIEVDGWAIDFMAPNFPAIDGVSSEVPSKMFQKKLETMCDDLNDLSDAGDFFYASSPETTFRHMAPLAEKIGYSELARICSMWFKKPPKKKPSSIQMANQNGERIAVNLKGAPLAGTW